MDFVSASLEGYDKLFATGESLIDASVTLGQNDLSSTGTITVADPQGKIAQALINHSLLGGGITKLEAPNAALTNSAPSTPGAVPSSGVPVTGGSGEGGVAIAADPSVTPEQKAFMDLIAYKEVHAGQELTRKGYFCNNGVGRSNGYFPESEAMVGYPSSALLSGGRSYHVGRYQFGIAAYTECKAADPRIKVFMPEDQDYACLQYMKIRGVTAPLAAGDIRGAILRAGGAWASLPGSPYGQVQKGFTMEIAIGYYNQRLAYYKGGATPPAKVEPTPAPTPTTAPPITASDTQAPPVKGNKLTITIGEDVFTYYHQSTEYDADNGQTIIGGQSIRYALDRRKRSRVVKDITLKEFAAQVTTNHRVKLDWQASKDIKFDVIDQRGMTDYAVLLQQAEQSGLFVSDDKDKPGTITIKPLEALTDTGLIFTWRKDITSAKFKDEALDATKEDKSSALLQGESKATIDPSTGTIAQTKPDVDTVPDNSTTGNKAPVQAGKPAPGQELLQAQDRSRVKRVQGLPSTLVVPMTPATRKLKPLDTIKTAGFVEVLNRIWVIDNIKHEPFEGTTTLNLYSPIEVLSLTPPAAPISVAAAPGEVVSTAPIGNNPGGFIYPSTNVFPFTPYGAWHARGGKHAGVDFAGGTGINGTIVAIADGIARCYPNSSGGYGNYIDIDHPGGISSRYAHCLKLTVPNGAQVKQGQEIAKIGNTGRSFGDHLHFEVFKTGHTFGRNTINPATLPGLSRCGVVGAKVQAGGKN